MKRSINEAAKDKVRRNNEAKDKDVHSPDHYTHGGIETRDYLLAKLGKDGFVNYCYGNVLKYVSRAKYKGEEVKDIQKAQWYLDAILEVIK